MLLFFNSYSFHKTVIPISFEMYDCAETVEFQSPSLVCVTEMLVYVYNLDLNFTNKVVA